MSYRQAATTPCGTSASALRTSTDDGCGDEFARLVKVGEAAGHQSTVKSRSSTVAARRYCYYTMRESFYTCVAALHMALHRRAATAPELRERDLLQTPAPPGPQCQGTKHEREHARQTVCQTACTTRTLELPILSLASVSYSSTSQPKSGPHQATCVPFRGMPNSASKRERGTVESAP